MGVCKGKNQVTRVREAECAPCCRLVMAEIEFDGKETKAPGRA